jgi:hypothetical protein
MRFRLLRRRLTISAPRMAVRSAMPWPFRWAVMALVMGFCAAIGLWAFEFGKDIAGIDADSAEQVVKLRAELTTLQQRLLTVQEERDKAVTVSDTSLTQLTTERAAQERLAAVNKTLESENQSLRADLGFFEKLIPSVGGSGMAVRGLQAEVLPNGRQVKWQVLVIQPIKDAPEFNGRLELVFTGQQGGKPWTASLAEGPQALKLRQYARSEGVFDLPPQTQLKGVSAKVMDGAVTKASASIKL